MSSCGTRSSLIGLTSTKVSSSGSLPASRRRNPRVFRYASLRLEDGLSFVHVAFVETRDGSNPLCAQAEFTEFTRDLEARCDEPPVATDVTVVGAYRLFEP